jgi:hypothetical protein
MDPVALGVRWALDAGDVELIACSVRAGIMHWQMKRGHDE